MSSTDHCSHVSGGVIFIEKISSFPFLLHLEDLFDCCHLYFDSVHQAQVPRLVTHYVGLAIGIGGNEHF